MAEEPLVFRCGLESPALLTVRFRWLFHHHHHYRSYSIYTEAAWRGFVVWLVTCAHTDNPCPYKCSGCYGGRNKRWCGCMAVAQLLALPHFSLPQWNGTSYYYYDDGWSQEESLSFGLGCWMTSLPPTCMEEEEEEEPITGTPQDSQHKVDRDNRRNTTDGHVSSQSLSSTTSTVVPATAFQRTVIADALLSLRLECFQIKAGMRPFSFPFSLRLLIAYVYSIIAAIYTTIDDVVDGKRKLCTLDAKSQTV